MATVLVPATRETKQKKGNMIGRLLQAQMLGLMARFADVINESMFAIYTVKEQLRCIRAMEEMIRVCKDYARIARPQVCTSMEETELEFNQWCRFPHAYSLHSPKTPCGSRASRVGLLC